MAMMLMSKPPMTLNDYFRERLFEMFAVASMLGMAITLLISPRSIEVSTFRLLLATGLTQLVIMSFLFVFGCCRMAALVINGRSSVVGPWVRAVGAGAGAFWWAQCCYALLSFTTASTSTVSMGVPMYLAATVCELIVATLAVQDVSTRRPGR